MTYGIDKDHAFVLKLQELGHESQVALELVEEAGHFWSIDFDYERFGASDALCRDHQVTRKKTR